MQHLTHHIEPHPNLVAGAAKLLDVARLRARLPSRASGRQHASGHRCSQYKYYDQLESCSHEPIIRESNTGIECHVLVSANQTSDRVSVLSQLPEIKQSYLAREQKKADTVLKLKPVEGPKATTLPFIFQVFS